MIRRLIGTLVTLAVLAVVVLTVLHRDRFETLLHFGDPEELPLPASDTLPVPVPTETLPAAEPARVSAVEDTPVPGADSVRGEEEAPADLSVTDLSDSLR